MAHVATRNGRRSSTTARRLPTPREEAGDQYQLLWCRLQSLGFGLDQACRTLGLTSCTRREGVTTVATNLALRAAQLDEARILVVDANLAHPSLHTTLQMDVEPGLLSALNKQVEPEESIQHSRSANLSAVTAGTEEGLSHRSFQPDHAFNVLNSVKQDFDLVIVDLPAIGVPVNLMTLSSRLDGVLLVLEAESISSEVAQRGVRQLRSNGVNLLGVVFNKRRDHLPEWIDRKLGE